MCRNFCCVALFCSDFAKLTLLGPAAAKLFALTRALRARPPEVADLTALQPRAQRA